MAEDALPLRFHFDFISPYAFLAWTQIRTIAKRHGRALLPIPVLFAALLDAHGQKGPAEIPAKRRYLFKDIARKAHRLGVGPVTPPPAHPFNPLVALRVSSLPEEEAGSSGRTGEGAALVRRERIIDALYMAVWTKRQAIDSAEAVTRVLSEDAGLAPADAAALVARAMSPEAKQTLRLATDTAIAEGVFGVPTIIVGSELFWGTDSLEDLEAFLRGDLPAFSDAGWSTLPSTATRKNLARQGEG